MSRRSVFFFNDTATTEIYTLSLHDALPISGGVKARERSTAASPASLEPGVRTGATPGCAAGTGQLQRNAAGEARRSEEHTSELQSRQYLVCRLLLEKKKTPTEQSKR